LYVSYDGMGEPLGQSQVMAYLERLSRSADVALVSFEKPDSDREAVARRLEQSGIRWTPLAYHSRPPVLSTMWDIAAGARAIRREARRSPVDVLHVRSYVPALMALRSKLLGSARLLFDIRGFWADERVDGGLWRENGLLYRRAKRWERRFFRSADAVVTLTEASVPQIERWLEGRRVPVEVIPTCVDVDRFVHGKPRPEGRRAVWSGSVGTWYRFDLAARVAAALGLPLTVLTREVHLARQMLDGYPADLRTVSPEEISGELFAGDVGLCLIRSSFSKTASAPTRFAEYLAAGMPVMVTAVGDLAGIVDGESVGVVLQGEDDRSLRSAADALKEVAADPGTPERCRAVARDRFDVDSGARAYESLYRALAA
jgi:glycosyltransferase involved in cell wall biosynthesis